MTRTMSDDEFETAINTWARETISATIAPAFAVDEIGRYRASAPSQGVRRHAPAMLASVAVLLAVVVGLAIRRDTNTSHRPASSAPPCPALAPTVNTDPGASPSNRAVFFPRPVVAMTRCSYPRTTRGHLLAAVPLDHAFAEQLARHLNNASPVHHDTALCLMVPKYHSVLVARDSHGTVLRPVVFVFGCTQVTASNGQTVRYLNTNDPFLLRTARATASGPGHK